MADPFTGEIRAFAFTFPPANWSQCNGQQVGIPQNNVLYAIIGNTYGGDLQTYFNLPNMLGRIPVATGTGVGLTPRTLGQTGGADTVVLTSSNFPAHNHAMNVEAPSNNTLLVKAPTAATYLSRTQGEFMYATPTSTAPTGFSLAANSIGAAGSASTAPRANDQPYLVVNFCICQYGDFPVRP
ncbi:microcystin-dependent protein [Nitrospirillum amazonense]|uniref:Microcystin-dependent protein n=1 Tax=Nitrospirillum amazonense TaxID=28077 RepID=A0A560FFL1_9PROT|nr:tail fiber protein [Nitrospirillum amazonense]TWB20397.1 microcystin-dependent protein [Nitrospirillum amazonense]